MHLPYLPIDFLEPGLEMVQEDMPLTFMEGGTISH